MRTSAALMTRYLVERGTFKGSEFGLVDVGASGGLESRWDVFGEQLRAWGFDPLESEIDRLNALGRQNVSFHAYWVGYKQYKELLESAKYGIPTRPMINNDPARRLSLWEAIPPEDVNKNYDGTGSMRQTERRIDLDDFFQGDAREAVDFIKVDTDGNDYEVLLGATALMQQSPVIGVQVECVLHGFLHPHVQLFANVDCLMREAGFSLFDMSAWRYSRAALPSKFTWETPGPTEKGQLWWGDFLYFRDLGDLAYEGHWQCKPAMMKVLKLACCFESYDLPDCAAELLLRYKGQLTPVIDVDHCLNLLTQGVSGVGLSYREYLERFKEDPKAFYASAPPVGPKVAGTAHGNKHPVSLLSQLDRRWLIMMGIVSAVALMLLALYYLNPTP